MDETVDIRTTLKKLEKDVAVCVVWDDARTRADWMTEQEIADLILPEIKTLGWYHGIINGGVVVKHNFCMGEREADGTHIPLGWIKRIIKMRLGK
jgi:hypothetical protein